MSPSVPETKHTKEAIGEMVNVLKAKDAPIGIRREALGHLRNILSSDDAPIHLIVSTGGIPVLIHELQNPTIEFQYDATCCLTNIVASGSHEQMKMVMNGAPRLAELLTTSTHIPLIEQTALTLGNLATDDELRTTLVANGVMQLLGRLLATPVTSKPPSPSSTTPSTAVAATPTPSTPPPTSGAVLTIANLSTLRVLAWALGLCVRAPTAPLLELFRVPSFIQSMVIYTSPQCPDDELVIEVSWLLSHVTAREQGAIRTLIEIGIIPGIVTRITTASQPLAISTSTSPTSWVSGTSAAPPDPALVSRAEVLCVPLIRLLGNLLSGPDTATDAVLSQRTSLSSLLITLQASHRGLRRESAFAISNIASGSLPAYADALVTAGFIPPLCTQLIKTNYDIQRECVRALVALCRHSSSHLEAVVDQPRVVDTMCDLLQPTTDTDLASLVLQFIELVLSQLPARRGPAIVQECDGIDALERLQRHDNRALWGHASRLVDSYFGGNDDDDEYGAPEIQGDRFAFGPTTTSGTFDFGSSGSSNNGDSKSTASSTLTYGPPSIPSPGNSTFVSPRMAALGLAPPPSSSSSSSTSPMSLRMQQLAARDAAEAAAASSSSSGRK
jgi:hypothetical protein